MAKMGLLYASVGLFLGCFIYSVQSERFEFGAGQPCILLDMDATFDLSMGEQIADPFTIDGANVTSGQSLCGTDISTALLTLRLFPSDETFKINFRREATTNTVSMSAVLNIEPRKHFENASEILPFELESSQDLPIGEKNMSYVCNSEQKIFFNQDAGYSMTMTITNLHVQAYDIENGGFSSETECEQDQFTTPPTTAPPAEPTTEPVTTTPGAPETMAPDTTSKETPASIEPEITTAPSNDNSTTTEPEVTIVTATPDDNATSPEPETISPSSEPEPTTTEMIETTTPRKIPKYEVKEGETVCIAIQGDITFDIDYEKEDGSMDAVSVDIPEDAKVDGSCEFDGSNTTQELKLTFFEDTWSLTVLIAKDEENMSKSSGSVLQDLQVDPDTAYSWQSVGLQYVIDDRFPDAKASEKGQVKIVNKNDTDDFRADAQGSYRCDTGETIQLEEGLSVDLGNFQYKAFNTDDSADFPDGDVTACPADNPDDDDDDDDTVAIVLGAVFGGLAFILLVGAIIYFLRRNRYKNYEVM